MKQSPRGVALGQPLGMADPTGSAIPQALRAGPDWAGPDWAGPGSGSARNSPGTAPPVTSRSPAFSPTPSPYGLCDWVMCPVRHAHISFLSSYWVTSCHCR